MCLVQLISDFFRSDQNTQIMWLETSFSYACLHLNLTETRQFMLFEQFLFCEHSMTSLCWFKVKSSHLDLPEGQTCMKPTSHSSHSTLFSWGFLSGYVTYSVKIQNIYSQVLFFMILPLLLEKKLKWRETILWFLKLYFFPLNSIRVTLLLLHYRLSVLLLGSVSLDLMM